MIDRCLDRGLDCLLIPPLYHLSDSSPLWDELSKRVGSGVLFSWLHPRPAEWLLRRHKIAAKGMTILDLRGFADAESAVTAAVGSSPDRGEPHAEPGQVGVPALAGPSREQTHAELGSTIARTGFTSR